MIDLVTALVTKLSNKWRKFFSTIPGAAIYQLVTVVTSSSLCCRKHQPTRPGVVQNAYESGSKLYRFRLSTKTVCLRRSKLRSALVGQNIRVMPYQAKRP